MKAEDRPAAPLTPREQQVMAYIAAGKPNKVVAIDLGISMRTVEKHRARIFSKLGVRNAVELVHCCYRTPPRSAVTPIMAPPTAYRPACDPDAAPHAVAHRRYCRVCGSALPQRSPKMPANDGENPESDDIVM